MEKLVQTVQENLEDEFVPRGHQESQVIQIIELLTVGKPKAFYGPRPRTPRTLNVKHVIF